MYTKKSIFHLAIRLLIALLASHIIVVQNTEETWLELFTKSYYYKSVFYSMVIAFLLIECVYVQTKRVNKQFEGHDLSFSLIKAQFLNSFLVAAFLAFLMATLLFWLNGQNIFESSYFENLFPYILVFILCFNAIYLMYFRSLNLPRTRYIMVDPDSPRLQNLRSKSIQDKLPAFIFYHVRGCFAIDFNGEKSTWAHTLEESMEFLNSDDYFQINKKEIVNRAAILSTKSLYPRCKIKLSIPYPTDLYASKRKNQLFKSWLYNESEDPN